LSLIGDAELIRSDVVRKELAGLVPHQSARSDFGHGIYSEDWSDRTYAECLRRAEHWLFQGRRVIIDGSFGKDARRHAAIQLAERLGVPGMALICQAEDDVVAQRLENRINDASDADWTIYEKAAERWEPVSPSLHERVVVIDTNSTPEHGFAQAQAWLRNAGLSD
jgi:predicted kinase